MPFPFPTAESLLPFKAIHLEFQNLVTNKALNSNGRNNIRQTHHWHISPIYPSPVFVSFCQRREGRTSNTNNGSTIRQGEGARYTVKVNGTDITEPRTDSNPQPVTHKTKLKVNPYTRFT